MLESIADVAGIPYSRTETVRDYLSRVAAWYGVPLTTIIPILEMSLYGTGPSPSEQQEFLAALERLREAVKVKGPPIGEAKPTAPQEDTADVEEPATTDADAPGESASESPATTTPRWTLRASRVLSIAGVLALGTVLAVALIVILLPRSDQPAEITYRPERVFPGLDLSTVHPVHLTHPGDGTDRIFVVLRHGEIVVFANEETVDSTTLFLDLSDRVNDADPEGGLLGLAFDPDYSSNGFFYVYYTVAEPLKSVILRFAVSQDDPNKANPQSELVILEVDQPVERHNAGTLAFGPDGYLYVALGDGGIPALGDGGIPGPEQITEYHAQNPAQDRTSLLGSILRIDVSGTSPDRNYRIPPDNPFVGEGGGVKEEIWAYGLRNPWRMSFDRDTGELWVGDVGENVSEEIDIVESGRNYGWPIMEGFGCWYDLATMSPDSPCDQTGLEPPIAEYSLPDNRRDNSPVCAIIGGTVYRGSRLPALYGAYIYGDLCTGRIWALRYDGSQVTEHVELVDKAYQGLGMSSFGEDRDGEFYVLPGGPADWNFVYRLVRL